MSQKIRVRLIDGGEERDYAGKDIVIYVTPEDPRADHALGVWFVFVYMCFVVCMCEYVRFVCDYT